MNYASWGNYPRVEQAAVPMYWRTDALPLPADPASTILPHGLGRSYGDSCLNGGNTIVLTQAMDRFLAFDRHAGLLTCEGGASFADILSEIVPAGWFLPVSSGTKFVTIGGAIANDVHGKNHHRVGTFGHAVVRFELLRSDGSRRICSLTENPELFAATIGGLGLTGLITWAEFRLIKISGPFIKQEIIKFGALNEFFALARESEAGFDHTAAWIDGLALGKSLGRGHFIRGNHAEGPPPARAAGRRPLNIPFYLPTFALNHLSIKSFNWAYYHRQHRPVKSGVTHYDPFFYPLDALHHWNRIYGRRGFFQYQCVVPKEDAEKTVRALLSTAAASGLGSFLSVMKIFGDLPPAGLLSFARPGVTLALDFPNVGRAALRLFDDLDLIVEGAGGAVYPAKDARMSATSFRRFFPRHAEFSEYVDPRFSSSFWRRVKEGT